MAKKTDHPGVVYRLVADNGKGNYGILVAVHSPTPDDTVRRYAETCVVHLKGEPKRVEGMDPAAKGIDARIEHIDEAPGFALRNKLKLNWWDRVLVDA